MRLRTPLVITVSVLLLLVLVSGPVSAVPPTDKGPWTSSAEPPDGLTPEQMSPPDVTIGANQNADLVETAAASYASLRVAGSALRPRVNDVSYLTAGGGGCVYVTTGNAWTVWNTSLYLPQGSTINYLRMFYNDADASNNMYGWVTVYDLYGNLVQEWAVQSTVYWGYSYADSAAIDHVVDYDSFSYVLNWRPVASDSTMQLCGFRVFYTPPPWGTYLPYVRR